MMLAERVQQAVWKERQSIRYIKALSSNYVLIAVNVCAYAVSVPLLLRWLGTERYGVWLIVLQLVYLVSLAISWIAAPVTREAVACSVASTETRVKRLFQTVAGFYAVVGTGLIGCVLLVGSAVLQHLTMPASVQTEAYAALLFSTLYVGGMLQLNLLLNLLTGFHHMHQANLLQAGLTVLGAGSGLAAVAMGYGLTGLAFGQVFALAVVYAVGWRLARKIGGVTWGLDHVDLDLLRGLVRSVSAYAGYSVSYLLLQSDVLLVGVVLGPAAAAIYGVAYKVADQLVQLIWKIPDSLFPIIAELDIRQSSDRLARVHRVSGKVAMATAFLGAILLAAYGQAGVQLWVGIENTPPWIVFLLFAGMVVLQVFIHTSLMISYGTNRMGSIARAALLEGAGKIAVALWLLPRVGIAGVALATILAQMSVTAWYVPSKACRDTGDSLWHYLSAVLTPALPAVMVAGVVGALTVSVLEDGWLHIAIGVPLVVGVYLVTYLSHGVTREEREGILEKVLLSYRAARGSVA